MRCPLGNDRHEQPGDGVQSDEGQCQPGQMARVMEINPLEQLVHGVR